MNLLTGRTLAALTAAALLTACFSSPDPAFSQDQERNERRALMRAVFLTLTDAYLYSLDPPAFEDPANRQKILQTLEALADNANKLETHGGGLDPSFEYLRRSLVYDTQAALERFQTGQYIGARWVLGKVTENCVTCHSKSEAAESFDLGAEFIDDTAIRRLTPSARAELQLATRQFDAALETFEEMFADREVSWRTLSLIGAFEKYLRISVVVRDDPARAAKALKRYRSRPDIDARDKDMVNRWIAALEELKSGDATNDDLSYAWERVRLAQQATRYPSDRARLVDFIVCTAALHRYLKSGPHKDVEVAEAYYLLAIAESHISTSYWISETDFLLEQAIRKAPKSEIAGEAYEFLVAYTTAGHTVMARSMTENVAHNLEELRGLMRQNGDARP